MPPTPLSNVEKYLHVIAGHGGEIPSEPLSRVEYYLDEIVKGGGIGGKLKPEIVSALPATGTTGILYLVPSQGSGRNLCDEYFWIEDESRFELLGQTKVEVDLSGYVPNSRKVGGKSLEQDIDISLTGTGAIKVTDNGTSGTVAFDISHEDSGVTPGSKGDTTNQTPGFGGTFKALSATVDAKGHVTALGDHTTKIPDDVATSQADGLMSKTDKAKLDTLIDDTLSNSDKAADAKATGDKIAALENENALLRELVNGIDAPIYRDASGNPATFADGYPANVKDLSVEITPTQAGEGDPYPPGGGKNLLDASALNTVTNNGITFTVLKNAVGDVVEIDANGTSTDVKAQVFFTVPDGSIYSDMILSGCPGGSGSYFAIEKYNSPYTEYVRENGDGAIIPTIPDGEKCSIIWRFPTAGTTANHVKFRPMIRRASDTDPTFAPYSNVRPISGATSVTVTRTGENGANPQAVTVSLVDSNSNPLTVYGGTLNVTTGELTVTHGGVSHFHRTIANIF